MDEELRQAIEAVKEQQLVTIDLEWYQGTVKLDDVKQFIRANINSASRSFVAIGYYLKYVRDKQLYKEDGYQNIWDFAQTEFGFSQSWASRCMLINDRFSKDGNSPIILDQYKDFDKSKLSEMLTLTDNQLEQVTVSTTVAEIKNIKRQNNSYATSHKEPEPKKPYYECAAYLQYSNTKRCKDCFYDKADCPYDRAGYFEKLKQQDIEIVDNEPEILNDVEELLPCDTCGNDVYGCCDYENTPDDYCVEGNKWEPKEHDKVETVEADIIQTVPEVFRFSAEHLLRDEIHKVEETLKVMRDYWKISQPDTLLRHETVLNAMKAYLNHLIQVEPEPPEPVQPELPILKNNEQRKAFIEAYESWPIWIDNKDTGERYYRYNLSDKVAIIVKVSKQHAWRDYKPTKKVEYASPVYYLLGVRANYSTKVEFVEDDTRTFYECCSNMTMLIDYLREYQKKK